MAKFAAGSETEYCGGKAVWRDIELKAFNCWLFICFLSLALLLLNHTWTRASVNFVLKCKKYTVNLEKIINTKIISSGKNNNQTTYFCASSSLVYTSGYWVLWKALSSSSNCSPVKVVLLLLCFRLRGIPGSVSVSDSSPLLGPSTTKYLVILKGSQWKHDIKFLCFRASFLQMN